MLVGRPLLEIWIESIKEAEGNLGEFRKVGHLAREVSGETRRKPKVTPPSCNEYQSLEPGEKNL